MPFPTCYEFVVKHFQLEEALDGPHRAVALATLAWAHEIVRGMDEQVARVVIEAHCGWLANKSVVEAHNIEDAANWEGTPSWQGVLVLNWVLGEGDTQ